MERKMLRNISLLFVVLLAFIPHATFATNCKGCVELDSFSLDKVVSKFKISVVKIDVAYPYGEKHDQFTKLSETLASNTDILVGVVGVKDYGDKENTDLAARFNVKKEEYPVLLLFKDGKTEPTRYEGEFKADAIRRFIRTNTGLWMGLAGCLEKFDLLSQRFATEHISSDRKEILRQAEDAISTITVESERKSADIYVKVMRKIVEKGDDFLQSELARVENLRNGKLSKEKKEDMERRLNILHSFQAKAQNTEL